MVAEPIKVDGLRQFVKDLKTLDRDLPKAVRLALNTVAEPVVRDARSRMPSRSGRAKRTVKARSTRTAVRVVEGSARVPYVAWLDFGGRVGVNKSVRRPFIREGRYLYKSYFDHKPRMSELMEQSLIDVARSAGVEVD